MKNSHFKLFPALYMFGFACVAATASPARAEAIIAWGSPTNISGPSDVITAGTYVDSATFSTAPLTVNGVAFNYYNGVYTLPSANLVNAADLYFTGGSHIVVGYDTAATFTNGPLNTPYADLLSLTGYTTGTGTITLGGLTVNEIYQVEVWAPYWNSALNGNYGGNLLAVDPATPQFIVGTFTANASTQVIAFSPGEAGALVPPWRDRAPLRWVPHTRAVVRGAVRAGGGGLVVGRTAAPLDCLAALAPRVR